MAIIRLIVLSFHYVTSSTMWNLLHSGNLRQSTWPWTCRWLISRIYILLISSCVIDYFQHIWDPEGSRGLRLPEGVEIFGTRPDWPWGPHSLLYNGYRVFLGGKAAGTWLWPHTPPSSADVKERAQLYLYPRLACSKPTCTFITYICIGCSWL